MNIAIFGGSIIRLKKKLTVLVLVLIDEACFGVNQRRVYEMDDLFYHMIFKKRCIAYLHIVIDDRKNNQSSYSKNERGM